MLSVAVGVQLEVRRNVEAVGLDTVYVMPPQVQTSGIDPYADPLPATPITPASVQALSRLPQVASVSPVVNLPAYLDLRVQRGDQAVLVQQSSRMTRLNPLAERGQIVAGRDLAAADRAGSCCRRAWPTSSAPPTSAPWSGSR